MTQKNKRAAPAFGSGSQKCAWLGGAGNEESNRRAGETQAQTVEVGDNRLTALAADIASEHRQAQGAVRNALMHAISAGQKLIEAKAILQHGAWLPWLAANFDMSDRTAQSYMRLARNEKALEAKYETAADFSLRGAIAAIGDHREPAIRILPMAGHMRIGVAKDRSNEIWIAPSLHHASHVYITHIFNGDATFTATGFTRPVAVEWASEVIKALGPFDLVAMEWNDEPFPPWNYNVLLFGSIEDYMSRATLKEAVEITNSATPEGLFAAKVDFRANEPGSCFYDALLSTDPDERVAP